MKVRIVTVGNSKGGVGKSTICANLAVAAAQTGQKVLIVDADVQASSMGFRSLRENNDIKATAITTATLHTDVKGFDNFDLIIIDAGGRDSVVFRSAVMAADLLLIPVLPSVYDIWAAEDTIKLVQDAKITKPDLKARLLLNQLMPNTIMGREALEEIEKFGEIAPVLDSKIYHRTAFKNSIGAGQGVIEFEPKGKAAAEIRALFNEVCGAVA